MAKLSKIQIIAKYYSRCTIVDIENIDAGILCECKKGAWGRVHCEDMKIIYEVQIKIK